MAASPYRTAARAVSSADGSSGSKRMLGRHAGGHRHHAGVGLELGAGGPHRHPGIAPAHALHRRAQADRRAQRRGERERHALVAARDAGGRIVVDVGDPAEVGRRHPVGRVGAGDLGPGQDRLARAGSDIEAVEQPAGVQAGHVCLKRPADRVHAGGQLLVGHGHAARLTAAIAHALVPQAEAEAVGQLAHERVLRQDELGAHLHHRAVVQAARPHASTHPVAGLEDHHVGARALQLVGRAQAGEPGAGHGDPHRAGRPAAWASTATAPSA